LHAKWNEQRTDWERHERYGHYDLLAMLIYMWSRVMVDRHRLPIPPQPVPSETGTTAEYIKPRVRSDNEQAREIEDALLGGF
jgi:hypothetical protein